MYPKKPLAQNVLFCPSTTLRWPISHHLLWLTPFWRGSTMTLLPRHRQTGTHKADGCDNSLPTLSWLEKRIEQRCDGEGHQAIVPQRAEWVFPVTPCRSGFKDWRGRPGQWRLMECRRCTQDWCTFVFMSCCAHLKAVCPFDWGSFKGSGWEGHRCFFWFLLNLFFFYRQKSKVQLFFFFFKNEPWMQDQ